MTTWCSQLTCAGVAGTCNCYSSPLFATSEVYVQSALTSGITRGGGIFVARALEVEGLLQLTHGFFSSFFSVYLFYLIFYLKQANQFNTIK